ncbi:MAG TPA: hypothetical protein VK789_00715 [Bryobacteraceae bacterium]|nr:hypothetical protein [Bryobacteraceae bacterium]
MSRNDLNRAPAPETSPAKDVAGKRVHLRKTQAETPLPKIERTIGFTISVSWWRTNAGENAYATSIFIPCYQLF